MRSSFFSILLLLGFLFVVGSGCSGRKAREARLKERDEVARQSQFYCQFVSGEDFPDIDVKTNIEMGKRCEKEKPFSLTHYVTPSKITGVMFCCHIKAGQILPNNSQPDLNPSTDQAAPLGVRVRRPAVDTPSRAPASSVPQR
jgi:hypothetical protein